MSKNTFLISLNSIALISFYHLHGELDLLNLNKSTFEWLLVLSLMISLCVLIYYPVKEKLSDNDIFKTEE